MTRGSAQSAVSSLGTATTGAAGRAAAPDREGLIVMRLRAVDQLFDPVDPSPPGDQDLSQWAAQYIVESVKEMRLSRARELEVVVGSPPDPAGEAETGRAVCAYFERRAILARRALRRLLRRGFVTLCIGAAFLAMFYGVSRLVVAQLGEGPVTTLLRESSMIIGWVAMWKPVEIFLYDWWPIVGERRMYERLSRISVRVVGLDSRALAGVSRAAPGSAAVRAIGR